MEEKPAAGARILAWLQALLGLSALLPGWALLNDPSGKALGMQAAWLEGSPLKSYFLPGLLLFGVIGIGNLAAAAAAFTKKTAPWPAIGLGAFLMAWILAQLAWLEPGSLLQPIMFTIGLAELALGIRLLRRN